MTTQWESFNPDLITVDWMHGPRNKTRLIHLKYKKWLNQSGFSPRYQYQGEPICISLPPSLSQSLKPVTVKPNKHHARLTLHPASHAPFMELIDAMYARVTMLLNSQLARYSDRLRVTYRSPFGLHTTMSHGGMSWVVQSCHSLQSGMEPTKLVLDKVILLGGRLLFLPFKLM